MEVNMAKKKKAKKKVTKKKVAKKATKKKAKKKVVKRAVKKKVKKKRKLNPALMRELSASDKLASIVGAKRITRQKAIKKFWDYVKKNDLQDSKNRRNINLDSKLKVLFGNKKQVSMFDAAKAISKNLK